MEALAYPCKHPSVSKLLTIHTKTMEAYTLWWNGGTLWKMLDYNTTYSPITNNCTLLWQRVRNLERSTQLITFKQNHVKLACAYTNIMNAVHHCETLHNNLSKDYIMLHFSVDKPDVVYIGLCDWGEVGCLQEVMPWFCMGLQMSKMPPTQKKNVLVGCLKIAFCL